MYQNLANVLQTYSQFVYYIKADPMLRNGFYIWLLVEFSFGLVYVGGARGRPEMRNTQWIA